MSALPHSLVLEMKPEKWISWIYRMKPLENEHVINCSGRRHTQEVVEGEERGGVSGMRPREKANSHERASCQRAQRGHHPATEHICEIQLMLREFALVILCYAVLLIFARYKLQLFLRKFAMVMFLHFVLACHKF